ncbi:MAG TPA: diaminopimelate epimerase [Acidimicrobiales bacterium]|jgi:diaminopimelate epimerase|nr:diaminopimelate epimerase [Acidimicrobiales bacterium]
MPVLTFTKHHGLGNDFLVLLDADDRTPLTAELARALCDRHTGVGADGLIRAVKGGPDADAVFELRNADGSPAEMSGNGMRCMAQALVDAGWWSERELRVWTDGGVRRVRVKPESAPGLRQVTVDMGPAKVEDHPSGTLVDMGNPHLVILDQDQSCDLEALGRQHADRNVELIAVHDGEVDLRVWERGVGATLACGTGSCAAVAAAQRWGLVGPRVVVHNPGGDVVVEAAGESMLLSGPTQFVARVEVVL